MNTIGRDKWPFWLKKIVGKRKCIEIKQDNGRYYAYQYATVWDKAKKRPNKKSTYLGAIKPSGIQTPFEASLKGLYEYGHVRFVWHVLQKNGVVKSLKKIYPDDWKVLLVFAMNRLIDPRPIKSLHMWYEKTYLIKHLNQSITPKLIARVLQTVGLSWKSQQEFFEELRQDGEKILYDGSLIFSSSQSNLLLERGYNKEKFLLTKANIVLAFSHDRFLPVFLRVIPGSIHEITTLDILLEELGEDIILVIDRGFNSEPVRKKLSRKATFIVPLKRNSKLINYGLQFTSFFMYRKRPIKYASYKQGEYFLYLYEDLSLRNDEEKTYYSLLDKGKDVDFKEEWAGKITLISNKNLPPQDVYEMWKGRDQIEKSFDVLQNTLDVDKPYVHKEETFRGYLFASFIGLLAYYMILRQLKKIRVSEKTTLNAKMSVGDVLLELSKLYKIEIGKKELLTERSKRVRELMEKLKITNLMTKNGWS